MTVVALADFGSTFTKVALVDGGSGRLLGAAQHPTTIDSDVMEGFVFARDEALGQAGVEQVNRTLAASSAAGGLRMVAIGLIDDLTGAAAHQCALGAGAKVTAVLSGRLTGQDVERIREAVPDVILFAGGTDGGDQDRVAANARLAAQARSGAAVVVACNREVASVVGRIFDAAGHETVIVSNVMPTVHRQAPEPAREAIRELFIRRVVRAKGLSRASDFFASVVMPTPAAVLACAQLIADGSPEVPGTGSAVIVDVGGATTDIHSVMPLPPGAAHVRRAQPAPLAAVRTVEGDLGVRWSADSVLALDESWLVERTGRAVGEVRAAIMDRRQNWALVPSDEPGREVDRALAASCIALGLGRHVGRVATHYIPGEGVETTVEGRDLREATVVVATGGSIVRDGPGAVETVSAAFGRLVREQPAPRAARIVIDRAYLAAAAGLLASVAPSAALRLLHEQIPGLDLAGATTVA